MMVFYIGIRITQLKRRRQQPNPQRNYPVLAIAKQQEMDVRQDAVIQAFIEWNTYSAFYIHSGGSKGGPGRRIV